MKALELVETLLNLVEVHDDLEVKVETEAGVCPVSAADFTYNDDETEAWIELDGTWRARR